MHRYIKLAFTLIVAFVPFGTFGSAVHAACNPGQIGVSADCPDYTAPATTAVPGPSMDGTNVVPPAITTTLFKGIVPPNGFMVEVHDVNTVCYVTDSITYAAGANIDGKPAGFRIF